MMMMNSLALAAGPCTAVGAIVCQEHLALGNATGELHMSWVSVELHAQATVQWGARATSLTSNSSASSQTYALSDMCDPVAVALPGIRGWEAPGNIYHASVPAAHMVGTDLYYRVGDAATGAWGDTHGPVHVGVRRGGGDLATFAAFGDMGTYAYAPHLASGSAEALGAVDDVTAAALQRAAPLLDAIFHFGDIAYANDGPQSRWRYYMEEISPAASVVPWMVGCGNHDCLSEANPHKIAWKGAVIDAGTDGGQCGVPYDARFRMPGDPAAIEGWAEARGGTRNNLFYGFELGLVHLVMISSEHDLTATSLQRAWLDAHLGAVDRQRTPFVILGLHRPLYSSTQGGTKAPEHSVA
jgi:hypothetical protein